MYVVDGIWTTGFVMVAEGAAMIAMELNDTEDKITDVIELLEEEEDPELNAELARPVPVVVPVVVPELVPTLTLELLGVPDANPVEVVVPVV